MRERGKKKRAERNLYYFCRDLGFIKKNCPDSHRGEGSKGKKPANVIGVTRPESLCGLENVILNGPYSRNQYENGGRETGGKK